MREVDKIHDSSHVATYECSNCRLRICIYEKLNNKKIISILRYPYHSHKWAGINSDELKALYDDSEKVVFT